MIDEKQQNCCCACRHPSLNLREGLSLRPLPGDPHANRMAGSAWSADSDLTAWLLTYRLLVACLCVGLVAWSVAVVPNPQAKWLIYLTHWGIVVVSAHCIIACILVFALKFMGQPDHKDGLHWSSQIYWLLYNIACPTAFMITVFYWAMLHGSDFDDSVSEHTFDNGVKSEASDEQDVHPDHWGGVLNVMVHAVNSAIMLFEIFFVALPSRLLHFYQPFIFGIVYLIFNAIYYIAGGTDYVGNRWVYAMVDWSNIGPTAVVVLLTALLLLAVHLFTVILSIFRDMLVQRFVNRKVLDIYANRQVDGLTNPAYKHDV